MLLSITTAEDLLKKKKKKKQFSFIHSIIVKKYCVFLPYLGVGGLGDAKLCRSTKGKKTRQKRLKREFIS